MNGLIPLFHCRKLEIKGARYFRGDAICQKLDKYLRSMRNSAIYLYIYSCEALGWSRSKCING